MGASSSVRRWYTSSGEGSTGINEHKISVPFHKTNPSVSSSNTCGYEIAYKIGEGAFSDVRVAYRKSNREKVAIKEINMSYYLKEYVNESHFEFNILSQLSHPDVIKIYEVFYSKKVYHMVSELLLGGELFDSICEREYYTEGDARKVMQTATETLRYCHSLQVIHRDIKPENLILQDKSPGAKIKLIDFGFARVVKEGETFSAIRGSSMYLSPEMIAGCYSFPTDVWSLGVVFYILLSGVFPFESPSGDVEETKMIISRGKYTFPSHHWVGVSLQAQDLVNRMLTLDPAARITMEGILEHPWMTNQKNKEVDISKNIQTIKQFQQNKKLKATALAVKATMVFKTNAQAGGPLNFRQKILEAAKVRSFSRSDSRRSSNSQASPGKPSSNENKKYENPTTNTCTSTSTDTDTTASPVVAQQGKSEGEREQERVGSFGTAPWSEDDELVAMSWRQGSF